MYVIRYACREIDKDSWLIKYTHLTSQEGMKSFVEYLVKDDLAVEIEVYKQIDINIKKDQIVVEVL